MPTLYDYFRSSAAYRVRIALSYKGVPFDKVPVHLVNNGGEQHSPAYQALNPAELVPTLVEDQSTSNPFVLTQSLAILEYLEEKYPHPPLLPLDRKMKALIRSFALSIACDIHPLNNLRVLNYLVETLNITEAQKTEWMHHWMGQGFKALESQLTAFKWQGPFCFGDSLTLADVVLAPQMFNAERFAVNLTPYPILCKVYAFLKTIPAIDTTKP